MDGRDNKVTIKILFFAKSRELCGKSEITFRIQSKIICGDLLALICKEFDLEVIKGSLILALNEEYLDDSNRLLVIQEGDEVAVIPPISGG